MSIPHQKFGPVSFAKINDSSELFQVLDDPWLKSETIIIKCKKKTFTAVLFC
jgi:hypothetical protein